MQCSSPGFGAGRFQRQQEDGDERYRKRQDRPPPVAASSNPKSAARARGDTFENPELLPGFAFPLAPISE
jgi:hypothetical protein